MPFKGQQSAASSLPDEEKKQEREAPSRKKTVRDMTEGPIAKHLVLFALPLLGGYIFQQLYNTVDSIVVGNFVGANALGAVTSNMPAINTLVGMYMGFSSGASVVISQFFGARDIKRLRQAVHTSMITTLLLGIAMSILGVLISPALVRLMNAPPEVAPEAIVYLRIYFSGLLGLMFYNMGSAILRAVGDSRRPLYFLIFSSITNIVLDLLFVIAFGMGVAGVAYATIISQFLSCILVFAVLFRGQDVYRLSLKEMVISPDILRKITYIGLPASIQMMLTSFSNVFVQGYINRFGAASTSGWGAYQRIDAFTILPVMSIGLAITTFVGQNAGAKKPERIRSAVTIALRMSLAVTVFISTCLFILAPQAIGLFNREPDVLYFGTLFLRMIGPLDFVVCMNQVYSGALRGLGDTRAPMLIMLFSFVVSRQIYLFIASHLTASIYPIALGYPFGWLVCSIILTVYYRRSGWEKRLLS